MFFIRFGYNRRVRTGTRTIHFSRHLVPEPKMETDQVFISFGTTGVRTTTRTMNLSRHPVPETKIKITLILINSLLHKASKYHQDHERAPRGKKKKRLRKPCQIYVKGLRRRSLALDTRGLTTSSAEADRPKKGTHIMSAAAKTMRTRAGQETWRFCLSTSVASSVHQRPATLLWQVAQACPGESPPRAAQLSPAPHVPAPPRFASLPSASPQKLY